MITTLINADDVLYDKQMAADQRSYEFMLKHSTLYQILDEITYWYYQLIAATICRWYGHDMEDTGSYAGPESGCEDFTCRRCHWNFTHIYY